MSNLQDIKDSIKAASDNLEDSMSRLISETDVGTHPDPKRCGHCGGPLIPVEVVRDGGWDVGTGERKPGVPVKYRQCKQRSPGSSLLHDRWRLLDSGRWWLT
jgi:hypothetical protein